MTDLCASYKYRECRMASSARRKGMRYLLFRSTGLAQGTEESEFVVITVGAEPGALAVDD